MADNTMWYSITTTTGNVMLNFNQITRVEYGDGPSDIQVYAGDVGPGYKTYVFSNAAERDDVLNKLNRVLNATNINGLPPQTD